MFASIIVLIAFLAVTTAFAPVANRIVSKTACNAIPPFNWPGSKMPPSPLESIFGGGAKEVAAPPAPPAPVKKASPFAAFGKKEAAPAPAAVKGKAGAKPVAAKKGAVAAKPAAKGAKAPVAKAGAKAGKAAPAAEAAPKKKFGLF
eukprot:CAMPEP_0119043216 /NCGR_PEP_ID=MMETSP1177-20130426/19540_1 /TAXON_ID=2985 /ORGANISM="Ochromonas sp, Strain CCMP1899" /LENGTH=145 /DNA_ID=CAMNT_0007010879 /DNA_START=32 /DNA_END=469 /DNA_ORIENTATION=+